MCQKIHAQQGAIGLSFLFLPKTQKPFMRLSEKSFGGLRHQRMFFKTPVLLILLRKINKTGVLKNILCRVQPLFADHILTLKQNL